MFVNVLFNSVHFVSHLSDPVMPTTGKRLNLDHNTPPKNSVKRNKQKKKVDPPQVDCLVCGSRITEANEEEGITGDDAVFVKVNVMHGYTELVLG